jgi:hypothetical protein
MHYTFSTKGATQLQEEVQGAGGLYTGNITSDDNDNDKPIKSLFKGKGLLPPVGLARLDS